MALDKVLKIYDENGNPVDYDILATDVKFPSDGKDLPTRLDEMEQEIGEGGYTPPQDGIPKTDLAPAVQTSLDKADTAVQDPNYVHTSNDYTTAEKTKLTNLPTNPVTSISVNGGEAQTPTQGNVNIEVQGGSVDSVTINGTKHTPDANGDVDLGTIVGEKGDKGDTGNVVVSDGVAQIGIINDLTTGGAGDALSAEMGKRLKQNVEAVQANIVNLYNKLANLAFLTAADKAAAAPTPLDWSIPKVTVTITNSIGNGAVIKHNGQTVGSSLQVDQGDELVLTIEPAAGKEFSSIAATVDGVSATLTESGGVYTLNAGHVNAAMTIVVSGTTSSLPVSITVSEQENCTVTLPSGTISDGDTVTIPITAEAGYGINNDVKAACISVKDADNNTDIPFTFSSNTTVAQNEFDSKIDAQIVFTASATNIVISVKAAVLLLKDRTISTGGVLSTDTSHKYCVLAPRIHAKEGTPFAAGDYIFYKFSNANDSACIVFYNTADDIMTYFQQAGAQNGKKLCNVGSYVTNNPTDELRAMFTQQYIESCYISYNTSNTDPAVDPDSGTIDPSAAVIHFGIKPYIIFDTSNS